MPQIPSTTFAMKAITVALMIALAASLFLISQMPEVGFLSTWEGRLVSFGTVIVGGLCFWVIAQRKQQPPIQV